MIEELCDAIRGKVELDGPAPGAPDRVYRHHLEDIADTADVAERLQMDQVSRAAQHVWDWFFELHAGSLDGLNNTITFQDVYQWSSLMKIKLEPWEARALVLMSVAHADARSKVEGTKRDGS